MANGANFMGMPAQQNQNMFGDLAMALGPALMAYGFQQPGLAALGPQMMQMRQQRQADEAKREQQRWLMERMGGAPDTTGAGGFMAGLPESVRGPLMAQAAVDPEKALSTLIGLQSAEATRAAKAGEKSPYDLGSGLDAKLFAVMAKARTVGVENLDPEDRALFDIASERLPQPVTDPLGYQRPGFDVAAYMGGAPSGAPAMPTAAPQTMTAEAPAPAPEQPAPLPGAPVSTGRQPQVSRAVRDKYLTEQAPMYADLMDTLTNYRQALRNTSLRDRWGDPAATDVLRNLGTQARLLAKEAANLGVLSGPDLDLMLQVIPDPTTWTGNVKELLMGPRVNVDPLDRFISQQQRAWQRRSRAAGIEPPQFEPLGGSEEVPEETIEAGMSPRGSRVEVPLPPSDIPRGSNYAGTEKGTGKPVWKAPDGKFYVSDM